MHLKFNNNPVKKHQYNIIKLKEFDYLLGASYKIISTRRKFLKAYVGKEILTLLKRGAIEKINNIQWAERTRNY